LAISPTKINKNPIIYVESFIKNKNIQNFNYKQARFKNIQPLGKGAFSDVF